MMQFVVDTLADAGFAAVAALGFAAVSAPSRRSLPFICLLAAVAHGLRFALMHALGADIVTASLAGSLAVGFLSLWAGRRCHTPLSCLFIPALLPMVPGMYAYRSVFALIMFIQSDGNIPMQSEYLIMFGSNFFTTIMVISVLAAGATLPKFIFHRLAFTMTRHPRP